jgi:hypothetical protein
VIPSRLARPRLLFHFRFLHHAARLPPPRYKPPWTVRCAPRSPTWLRSAHRATRRLARPSWRSLMRC